MKLALVTETYPPEVNGVAMTLSRLVRGLLSLGHEVEVVRPLQKDEARQHAMLAAGDGSTHFVVPGLPIPFYKTLRMGFPVGRSLTKRWRVARPDIVHVATEGPLGLTALHSARRLGLPVSSSFHTNFHQYGGHYGLQFGRDLALRYLRWFHNRTACTLVPTDEMRSQFTQLGFERLELMARGVDARLFSPARRSTALREKWGAGPDDPVVIHVGRMAAEKNLELAVRAFLAIQAIEARARFVLVGDGPERAALSQKYPNFHYAGMRRGEDLAEHYASADLFPFPSITETFGNVVTEAMASGLVVVAYDYAAARQHLRHTINGCLVEYNQRDRFIEAVQTLMAAREQWPRLRKAARESALAITWDAIVLRFEAQLAGLAAKPISPTSLQAAREGYPG